MLQVGNTILASFEMLCCKMVMQASQQSAHLLLSCNPVALISVLANRTDRKQNSAWYKIIIKMQGSQETINSVYLVWCLTMKFTDIEKKNLGTANWQSDHYKAFTRVSLFHFSSLDNGDITNYLDKQLILSFRSMIEWLGSDLSPTFLRKKRFLQRQ